MSARQGMTGFARAEGVRGPWRWAWEAKSVNGRGLDVKLRLPTGQESLEPPAKDAIAARFKRGSIQIGLTLRREATAAAAARLDLAFLEAVIQAGQPYVLKGLVQPPRWDGLLALRGAFLTDDDAAANPEEDAALGADLMRGLNQALDDLAAARRREGAHLTAVLAALANEIAGLVGDARGLAGAAPQALAEKLQARLRDLAAGIDPQRLAQEVALLAAKADVREELDRLDAHLGDLRALLAGGEPIGRKLDFLTQEFNREANTVCSKSSDTVLTRVGLALKAAIDQLREQAANVE